MDIPPIEGMVVRHVIHGQGRFRFRLFPAMDGLVRTMEVRVDEYQPQDVEHGNSVLEHDQGHVEKDQGQTGHGQCQIGHSQGQIGENQGYIRYGQAQKGLDVGLYKEGDNIGQRDSNQGQTGQEQCQNGQSSLGLGDENHNTGQSDQNKCQRPCGQGEAGHIKHQKGDDYPAGDSIYENKTHPCQNTQHEGQQEMPKRENAVNNGDKNQDVSKVSSKAPPEPQSDLPPKSDLFPVDFPCPISMTEATVEKHQEGFDIEDGGDGEGAGDLAPPLQVTRLLAAERIPKGSVIWEFCPRVTDDVWTEDDVTADVIADVTDDVNASTTISPDVRTSENNAKKGDVIKTVVIARRPDIPTELKSMTTPIRSTTSDTREIYGSDALPDVVHLIEMDGPEKCFIKDTCLNLNDIAGDSETEYDELTRSEYHGRKRIEKQNDGITDVPSKIVNNITFNSQSETAIGQHEKLIEVQNEAKESEAQDGGDVTSQYRKARWEPCSAVERVGLEAMYENPEGPAALILLLYVMVSAYHSPSMTTHYVILNNHLRFAKYANEANVSIRKSQAKVKVTRVEEEMVLIDQVIATRDIAKGDEITRDFKMINEMEDMGNSL